MVNRNQNLLISLLLGTNNNVGLSRRESSISQRSPNEASFFLDNNSAENSIIMNKTFSFCLLHANKISPLNGNYLNPSMQRSLSNILANDQKRNQQVLSSIIEYPIQTSQFDISILSSDKESDAIYANKREDFTFSIQNSFTHTKEDHNSKSDISIEINFQNFVDNISNCKNMQRSNSAVFYSQTETKQNDANGPNYTHHLSKRFKPLQKKLFEKFLIIGIGKKDISLVKEGKFNVIYKFIPKILYSYPAVDINFKNNDCLKAFSFPFGVRARRMINDSFSNLNDIMFNNKYERMNSNCFVYTIKSSEAYDFEVQLDEVIEKSNPNRLLYIISIKIEDFCHIRGENANNTNQENWKIEKVFCIVTYYPCINFFIQFLIQTLNMIKFMRTSKINCQNEIDLSEIDSEYVNKIMMKEIEHHFEKIMNFQVPDFGKTAKIDFSFEAMKTETFSLKIEEKKNLYLMEALWCSSFVFSYLSLKDLLFLFAATILECKLVIMSKIPALSTGVLFVLYSLMKPFICQSHMLFNIPEKQLDYLDAPGGLLLGINEGESFLKNNRLLEKYSCIYVCLDEKKVYGNKALISEIAIPDFDGLEKKLAPYYYKLNNKKTRDIININPKSSSPNTEETISQNVEFFNKDEKPVCMKIMSIFENALQKNILEHLPKEKMMNAYDQINYKSITYQVLLKSKKNSEDTIFLTKFFNTQAFHYYIEQKYCS